MCNGKITWSWVFSCETILNSGFNFFHDHGRGLGVDFFLSVLINISFHKFVLFIDIFKLYHKLIHCIS